MGVDCFFAPVVCVLHLATSFPTETVMVCLQMPNVKLTAVKHVSLTRLIYCTSVGPQPVNPPTCSNTLMATSEIIQVSMLAQAVF